MVLKELADLGFVFAFRFYGRYPETGPRFYHPPCCESDRAEAEATAATAAEAAAENGRRRVPLKRPGLATILPGLPAPDFPERFLSGTLQKLGQVYTDGGLPSPAPQSVGAH